MIGSDLKAVCQMEDLLPSAREPTRPRILT